VGKGRGCFGWHRCRVGSAVGMDWVGLVYALGCLLVARAGQLVGSAVGLWDRHRRSASVLLLGLVSLMVKCWRGVLSVDSEILCFCSGGKPVQVLQPLRFAPFRNRMRRCVGHRCRPLQVGFDARKATPADQREI